MKKLLLFLFMVLSACSEAETQQQQNITQKASPEYEKMVFNYKKGHLQDICSVDSPMICAVDRTVKCTIEHTRSECQKDSMPSFIFMEDETLQRPTEMRFQIYKLKPISGGEVEVYTQSKCNGKWFDLCQGNVIYVLSPKADGWFVRDIYATE